MKTKAHARRTVPCIPFDDRDFSESVGDIREEGPIETPNAGEGVEDAGFEEEDDDFVEEGGEEEEHIPVEENAEHALSNLFGNVAADDDDSDCEDIYREDAIPDPVSDEEAEPDRRGGESEDRETAGEEFKLGKCYSSGDEFKQALLRYSLLTQYDIKLYVSTEKRLGAVCSDKEKSCKWRVYCSYEKRKRKLQTKYVEDKHTCIRSGYSKMLKVSTIAQLYEEKLRSEPTYKAVDMVADIKTRYNLIVTIEQCRKAKSKLYKQRRISHDAQFARIWDYEAELRKSNAGTIVDIETIPGPTVGSNQRFARIYISFEPQRTAWRKYCRPIIGLDGAFLKWDIKGQLLAAVGRDGDNRIVPIAWAVVEIENDINWDWFLEHLRIDLRLEDGSGFTIISDKQKGLVKAIQTQVPEAEHRQCARHVLGNWKRDNNDMMIQRLFWRIARSYTVGEFNESLMALRQANSSAHESLLRTNPQTWSRAYFNHGSCCNDVLNNLSESFNKTIREARRKPVLDLLEDIRRQCMVRTQKRSVLADRWQNKFTKSAHREIEMSIQKSRDCVRYMSTSDRHEVNVHGCSYRVDMSERKCGCGKWQLNGIPCEHAASVIIGLKLSMDDYVSQYFLTSTWQMTYRRGIQPVQGMKLWPRLARLPVLPPPHRVAKAGRPSRHSRRKSVGESSSTGSKNRLSREKRIISCSKCKQEGHNKLSCKNTEVQPPAKRPRGRPRKTPGEAHFGGSQGSQPGGSQIDGGSQVAGSQVG